jgi:hypothetical protein
MVPNTSNNNPAEASDLAPPQIADCGASSDTAIRPSDRIAIMTGNAMPSRAVVMAFLAAAINPGRVIAGSGEGVQFARPATPKRPLTEIERWNAEVDERKAQKKLDRQHVSNMQEG